MWGIKATASIKPKPLSICMVQGTVLSSVSHGFCVLYIHIVTGLSLEDQQKLEMAKDYSVILFIMGCIHFPSFLYRAPSGQFCFGTLQA